MVDNVRRSRRLAQQPQPQQGHLRENPSDATPPRQGSIQRNSEQAVDLCHDAYRDAAPTPTPYGGSSHPSTPGPAASSSKPAAEPIELPEHSIPLFDFHLELGGTVDLEAAPAAGVNYTEIDVFLPCAHADLHRTLQAWMLLQSSLEPAQTDEAAAAGMAKVAAAAAPAAASGSLSHHKDEDKVTGNDKGKARSKSKAKPVNEHKKGSSSRGKARKESPPPGENDDDKGAGNGPREPKTLALEVELLQTKHYLSDLGVDDYRHMGNHELVFQVLAHAPLPVAEKIEAERKRLETQLGSSSNFEEWFGKGFDETKRKFERDILHGNVSDECVLGYVVPSAFSDKGHPLQHLEEHLVPMGWVTLYGEVTLREPFFPPDEPITGPGAPHPWGRAERMSWAYDPGWWDPLTQRRIYTDSPHSRAPPSRLLGDMLIEVGLGPPALLYGADGHADGFIEHARDLPDNVPINSLTLARSLKRFLPSVVDWADGFIEVNEELKSFWNETKSFYELPPERTSLATAVKVAVQDKPTPRKQTGRGHNRRRKADAGLYRRGYYQPWRKNHNNYKAAGSSHDKLGEARFWEEADAEAKEDDESYLPLDTNVASLLEMCRPPRDGEMQAPPPEAIPTPLLSYQARCLAWMIDRETALDDETDLTYPTWLALRTKPVAEVNAIRRRLAVEWRRKLAVNGQQRQRQKQQKQKAQQRIKEEEKRRQQQQQQQKQHQQHQQHQRQEGPPNKKMQKGCGEPSKGKGKAKAQDSAFAAVDESDVVLKEPFSDPVDLELYFDETSGMVSLRRFTCRRREPGGVLCESMGLGKTLESLALIASNPCPGINALTPAHRSRSATMVSEMGPDELRPLISRATLVVCPAALMEQWLDEIRKHFRSRQTPSEVKAAATTVSALGERGSEQGKQQPVQLAAPAVGQSGTVQPGVVRFSDETFKWNRSFTRAEVRDWTARNLVEPEIVVASYEDLAAQLLLSQRTADNGSGPRSPLLEVLWWRVMLDEAQIVASSPGKATAMVHELWRVNCWMVTGTPVTKGIRDLHGIFSFLDHDPLASPHMFKELLERPFADAEVEGIRKMRAVLPRYMWRHTKVHVQDEIALLPSHTEWLELELPEVERLFYEREVKRHREHMARRAGRGFRDPGDVKFLVTLRQLLSHPQVAQQLGYGSGGKRLTFDQLFSTLCAKSDAELNALRRDVVLATLQLIWGQDFYEERDKRRWTAGHPILPQDEVCVALLRAFKICEDAYQAEQAAGVVDDEEHDGDEAAVEAEGGSEVATASRAQGPGQVQWLDHQAYRPKRRGKRKSSMMAAGEDDDEGGGHVAFRWAEALYWIKLLLHKHTPREEETEQRQEREADEDEAADAGKGKGKSKGKELGKSNDQSQAEGCKPHDVRDEVVEPKGVWDPERPTRVFFEKAFRNAADKSVDLNDPRFHLIVQDAGSEDMDDAGLVDLIEAHRRDLHGDADTQPDDDDDEDGGVAAAKRRKTSPKGGGDTFEPTLKKSRLRGNAAQRQQARVWYYKPREKLITTHTRLRAILAKQGVKEREVAFLHTRRDEVLGPQAAGGAGDGAEGDGDVSMAECGVCLEAMLCPGVLPCYHSFCLDCLQRLASDAYGGARCPNCRIRFTADDITEIIRPVEERRASIEGDDDDVVVGDFGGKISGLIRDLRRRLRDDPTHKAVVFSHWKTMLSFIQTALLENGIGAVAFAGGSTSQSHALTSIRDDVDVRVILVPFRASEGAAGLTLTCCDLAYLMEPAMDGALEAQAIGRINRIGQTKPTTVIRVKMKDTVEQAVIEIAEEKARQGLVRFSGAAASSQTQPQASTDADASRGDTAAASVAIKGEEEEQGVGETAPSVALLRAQSIATSLSSTVGAVKSSSESSHQLTMRDVAKILGFDVEEERRRETERKAAAAQQMRDEMERMGFVARIGFVEHEAIGEAGAVAEADTLAEALAQDEELLALWDAQEATAEEAEDAADAEAEAAGAAELGADPAAAEAPAGDVDDAGEIVVDFGGEDV